MWGDVRLRHVVAVALIASLAITLTHGSVAGAQELQTKCDGLDGGGDGVGSTTAPPATTTMGDSAAAASWGALAFSEHEPPNVVGELLGDALVRLEEWNNESWGGEAEIDEIPDTLPPSADRNRVVVIDQADDLRDATVYLCLGARVPHVIGDTLAGARRTLVASGLVARVEDQDATGDLTVANQDLAEGRMVHFGTPVGLQLLPPGGTATTGTVPTTTFVPETIAPPPAVIVPRIIGLSARVAERKVEAAGLVFIVESSGEGDQQRVVDQDPAPGREVPRGTVVLATLGLVPPEVTSTAPSDARPADAESSRVPLAVIVGLLLAVTGSMAVRNRLRRKWVLSHLALKPRRDERPQSRNDDGDDRLAHVARFQVHPDPGTQTLEEVTP